jgi:hypothetical protein
LLSPARFYAALIALYTVTILLFFVAPVGSGYGDVLLGSAVFRHDAVLNAGILEWGFKSLWSPHLHFFDWRAGYPVHDALAGTENLSGWQIFYSPLRAIGTNVAAAYNTTLLSSLLISGVGLAALARRFGVSQFGSAFAGFAFAFNPFHVDHMIHLQTMAICWSPIALLALDMVLENRSRKGLALLGFSFLMTVLCGMYFGVFLTIVLILYSAIAWITKRYEFSLAVLRDLIITALLCGVILSPVLIHYFEFARSYGAYPHKGQELTSSSLTISSLVKVPAWLPSGGHVFPLRGDASLFASAFPGVIVCIASIAALVFSKGTQRRQVILPLLLLATVCWLLSLGPTVEWRAGDESRLLNSLPLPGKLWLSFSAIRWPERIFMYSIICGSVIAGVGVTQLVERIRPSRLRLAEAALISLMFLELRPSAWFSRHSAAIVDPIRMSDAYPFLSSESDSGGVVELPSKMDSGLVTPFATRYAYGSAGHLRKVVAFHGSMFPPVADSLRTATYNLPEPEAILMIKAHGVTRLVIHKDLMSRDSVDYLTNAFRHDGDSVVFDGARSTIFSLRR